MRSPLLDVTTEYRYRDTHGSQARGKLSQNVQRLARMYFRALSSGSSRVKVSFVEHFMPWKRFYDYVVDVWVSYSSCPGRI